MKVLMKVMKVCLNKCQEVFGCIDYRSSMIRTENTVVPTAIRDILTFSFQWFLYHDLASLSAFKNISPHLRLHRYPPHESD